LIGNHNKRIWGNLNLKLKFTKRFSRLKMWIARHDLTDDRRDNRTGDWTDDGTGDQRYYRTNTTTHAHVFLLHFVHRTHKMILNQQDIHHATGSYTVHETEREHG